MVEEPATKTWRTCSTPVYNAPWRSYGIAKVGETVCVWPSSASASAVWTTVKWTSDGACLRFSVRALQLRSSQDKTVTLRKANGSLCGARFRRILAEGTVIEIVGFTFPKKKVADRLFVNFAQQCVSLLQRESSARKLHQMWQHQMWYWTHLLVERLTALTGSYYFMWKIDYLK